MYIIGISAYYHDSSACLFKNGELVFACEEEKFTGIKHDSSFPKMTLDFIFKTFKLKKEDITAICYYENPKLKLKRVKENIKSQIFKNPLYSIRSYFKITNNIRNTKKELSKYSDNIFYSEHHLSHQYYSFFISDYKESNCLSVDGVGEIDTLSFGLASDSGIEYKTMSKYPHSLGLFYSAMTSYLGFRPNEGEYKMMGLASYGDYRPLIDRVRKLITFKNGELKCDMDVFCWDKSDKSMFNEKLYNVLRVDQRLPDEPIHIIHKNLAASIQKVYEEILFKIINYTKRYSENTNLCLSGGCAYNGTANGKITRKTHIKSLWIPPAPSDAGSSIGACVHYMVENNLLKQRITKNPFLGPRYNYEEYLKDIKKDKIFKFTLESRLLEHIALNLKKGMVVGWFQGRCEFGARALGNRSILANPTLDGMKDKINRVIKKREGFRPFAPMVSKERQYDFFEMVEDIPYMNQVVKVKEEYINILKAVTHVDGTARVQTVQKNTKIHDLLLKFEQITGYPILLNTSFNIKDKTMVLTPKDAIDTFYDTEMDILVIGNYVIYK
jgi:carbamoyltransferase